MREKTLHQMPIWNDVLDQLKSKLSVSSFDTWLSRTVLRPFDPEDDKLNIEVQNEFSRDWIKGRYEQLISDTIFEITGNSYKLNFIVNSKLETTNEHQSLPIAGNETINNKLDTILEELKQMNKRINDLESKI